MKVLVIGDPHFKIKNFTDTDELRTKINSILDQNNYDFVVVLGDVLDRFETCHLDPLKRVVVFLKDIKDKAPLYVLIGNHDRKNNKDFMSDIHPLSALKYWDNTTIVDTTLKKSIKGFNFIFVPYVYPGRFMEALNFDDSQIENNFPFEEADCIFAHQEFYGCNLGIHPSMEGDKWEAQYPLVISGHIHEYDRLQNNIIYTGTPYQINFGDGRYKTISEFEFFKNKIPSFQEKRINLGILNKVVIKIVSEEVESYNKGVVELPENSVCKIQISGTHSSILQHPTVKNWRKLGHETKFVKLKSNDVDRTVSVTNKKFIDILYENIKNDDELVDLYNEIFYHE